MPEARIINARSETTADKPLFKDGMARRRYLIPASYYFEWEKRGKEKIRYAIVPQEGLLTMAGVYRIDPQTRRAFFVILTRAAAPGIAFIHDRMPAILTGELSRVWLDPKYDPREMLAACAEDMAYRTA